MRESFNGTPCTTIVSCYSYTDASDETDTITFYNDLFYFVRHIPKHNVLIIGRHMNAQIGKDGNNKFGVHNLPNRNGEYLADFSVENSITYINTKFPPRKKGRKNYEESWSKYYELWVSPKKLLQL